MPVGADRHYGVLYSIVVGHTSDSKSNSLSPIRLMLAVTQRRRYTTVFGSVLEGAGRVDGTLTHMGLSTGQVTGRGSRGPVYRC
jgi:hypothetical protein